MRAIFGLLGFTIGLTTYASIDKLFPNFDFGKGTYEIVASIGLGLVIGLVFYVIEPWFLNKLKELVKVVDKEISKYPQTDILLGSIGLIGGFLIAYLLSSLLIGSIPIFWFWERYIWNSSIHRIRTCNRFSLLCYRAMVFKQT